MNYNITGNMKFEEPWSLVINNADDHEHAKDLAVEQIQEDNPDAILIEVESWQELK